MYSAYASKLNKNSVLKSRITHMQTLSSGPSTPAEYSRPHKLFLVKSRTLRNAEFFCRNLSTIYIHIENCYLTLEGNKMCLYHCNIFRSSL